MKNITVNEDTMRFVVEKLVSELNQQLYETKQFSVLYYGEAQEINDAIEKLGLDDIYLYTDDKLEEL